MENFSSNVTPSLFYKMDSMVWEYVSFYKREPQVFLIGRNQKRAIMKIVKDSMSLLSSVELPDSFKTSPPVFGHFQGVTIVVVDAENYLNLV